MAVNEVVTRRRVLGDGEVIEEVPVTTTGASSWVSQLVYSIAGIVETLLAIRFVLALLGANVANGFVNFIYSVTSPLVSPFFGMFGTTMTLGIAKFEVETLVAMVIYALVAYLVAGILRAFNF